MFSREYVGGIDKADRMEEKRSFSFAVNESVF